MTSRHILLLLGLSATMLAATIGVSAQFDTPNRSFHNATAFRLDGKHQSVPCEACHLNGQYRGTPKTCMECHWIRRKDDRYQTRLGTQCEQCHRPVSWTAVQWDHAQTGVRLNADHRQLACASCHTAANFRSATANCVSCHQKDYSATKSPNHAAAGFPTTCDACHNPGASSWQSGGVGGFHAAVFPLVGVHATQACSACHVNNIYKGTPRTCVGCHQTQYTSTRNPNHIVAGFPTTCDSCHRPTDATWLQGTFNHTRFPITGRHNVACAQCHTTPNNFAIFSCTVCHSRAETDSQHRGRNGYVYESNACYGCHPTGRAG